MTTSSNKDLVFFLSHLDDFEFSCMGYLFKNHKNYNTIKIVIATTWDEKKHVWKQNLSDIKDHIGKNIETYNLGFSQRTLTKNFDDMKDKFYKIINFNNYTDIITHDTSDLHSDHLSVSKAARGLLKYVDNFLTCYSPSSYGFEPNLYVEFSEEEFNFKHNLLQKYDFSKEQSYTKKGSYFRKEYSNIPAIYSLENFVNRDLKYCEIYKIQKWVQQ